MVKGSLLTLAPALPVPPARRFTAGEASRLLTAWAYLRRRQPFNPGGQQVGGC